MSKVFKAVKKIVSAVVNVVTSVVKAVVNVVSSVFSFVTQGFMGVLGGAPDLTGNEQAQAQAQGVLIQRSGSVQNIPVVYGCRKIAGLTPYIETSTDERSKYLYVSYVFSEGLVEGLRKVYIDDNDLDQDKGTLDYIATRLNQGETVTVNWGKYKGRVILRWSPGVYYTDPSTSTLADKLTESGGVFNGAPNFTSTMVYNGLATLFVRYEWFEIKTQEDQDSNPFSGSVPVVTVEMLGRRVQRLHDPDTDTDITATDSAAYGTNESYSINPVEILLDYVRNPRYGKGLSVDDIDWASWHTAAAKCNQQVQFTDKAEDVGAILQLAPILDTSSTIFNNIKILLQQFRAYMPYVQGKFKLKIEDAGNPTDITSGVAIIVKTYTKDDIVGSVDYTGIERGSKYNQVVVTYVDPDPYVYKYTNQTVVYPATEAERQTYINQDGGREYKLEITMPGITNRAIAFDMARLLFNKSRYQETCSITVTSASFDLELGDSVRIQSTILNFNDVPWRVISMNFNEDNTITLGCVRNPDFIYPHVRAGERDIVLPTYIPKGVGIYYPENIELYPEFSLHPPKNASLPSGVSSSLDTANNPVPSTNTPGLNETPPPPVSVLPLVDVIANNQIRYDIQVINGQIYADITWSQPNITLYQGLAIYWGKKANWSPETEWIYDQPGVGQAIVAKGFGPLEPGVEYEFYHRILYTTGESSLQTGVFTIVAPPATSEPSTDTNIQVPVTETSPPTPQPEPEPEPIPEPEVPTPSAPPVYNVDTSSPPTETPTGTIQTPPQPQKRDNWLDTLTAEITSAGYSASPRYMTLTLKTATASSHPVNPDIRGFNIYYKESLETYYVKVSHLPVNYNPSEATSKLITFTGYGSGAVTFDMVIRVLYLDGSESTNQHRFQFTLTSPFALYPYNPLQYGVGSKYEATNLTEAQLKIRDQDTNPAAVGALDMVLPLDATYSIFTGYSSLPPSVKFVLWPPNASDRAYWAGQKVRYRPVRPGQDPDFVTFYDKNVSLDPTGGTIQSCVVQNIVMDQLYEFVITPQVISGGNTVDATNSWFGTGYVNRIQSSQAYPKNGDWNFNFNWQVIKTSLALQQIDQAFTPPVAADATIQLDVFETRLVDNFRPLYTIYKDVTSSFEISHYHNIRFYHSHIANYGKLYVYRRMGNLHSQAGLTYNRYWGLGRWERISVTDLGTGGYVTINLRGPTSSEEYSPYYQTPGYGARTDYLKNTLPNSGGNGTGLMTNNLLVPVTSASTPGCEYLFVVEFADTTISTKGLLVRTKGVGNQLSPDKPLEVSISDYDGLLAGYDRRLSDARTSPLTNTQIAFSSTVPKVLTWTGSTPASLKYLTYPTTDQGAAISPAIV